MRTTPHALPTDRRATPRRLVPRRPSFSAKIQSIIADAPLTRFHIGDEIHFSGSDGYSHNITILGIAVDDTVHAMAWDGNPHLIDTNVRALEKLRVIRVERANMKDVADYRCWLGLDLTIDLEVA